MDFYWANEVSTKIHISVRNKVLGSDFPCVGGKAAIQRNAYRIGIYNQMGEAPSTEGLVHDLYNFFQFQDPAQCKSHNLFVTFIAVFPNTFTSSEAQYHDLLWKQLQMVHELDGQHYVWDPRVNSDIQSTEFSYSIGSCAFFVVGMNPHSSRFARRLEWPALVFNAGPQFEEIRDRGIHDQMKITIREREMELQGSINPTLTDFGEGNVALTYSGMNTNDLSRCPFHAHAIPLTKNALE